LARLPDFAKSFDNHVIRAPADGLVTTIDCTPKQKVAPRTLLLVIRSDQPKK
jgi:multidrug resistance efflux pump